MSGQWEVVGKKRDKSTKQNPQKLTKEVKKNNVVISPKIEDVLPMSQVKNLYKSNKDNKENQKPVEKKNIHENGNKKQVVKKSEKQESTKPKPPKSIESALNLIDVNELKQKYEKSKTLFPDAPVVWLKELAQYLNQKIPVEISDPVFSTKQEEYPLCNIPSTIKNILEKSINEAGVGNTQLFFDISLTVMANDMSKGLSAIGHKLYLQYIAINNPNLAITNLTKHSGLRNSYQNRQPIGLSIIWALGQCGLRDLSAGLKVFQEIMLPLIEMKNYSRYIIKYLIDLINRHKNSYITKDQYLLLLDIIFSNKKNFPNDLSKDLNKILPNLKKLLFNNGNNEKYYSFVEILLRKLQINSNNSYRDEICDVLITCLNKDQTSFGAWSKNYTKSLPASAILLNYIEINWKIVFLKLNKKVLNDMLNTFSNTNDELVQKKKKEDGLKDSIEIIKKLNSKMVAKKGSGFPFKTLSFLLFAAISCVVYFDIKQNGSWETSKVYLITKQSGIQEYALKAYDRTLQGAVFLNKYAEDNFPEYYQTVVVFVEPYIQLSKDLGVIAYNFFVRSKEALVAKYPHIIDSIDAYAPGLMEQSQKAMQNVVSTSTFYINRSVNYLTTEVFVGQLAPENMQRVVLEAFNTTQQIASEYYYWLYEKVQTTIK